MPACMRVGALAGRGRRLLERLSRRIRRVERRVVTPAPLAATGEPSPKPVGRALLSYILDPYLLPPESPEPHSHTHFWESREIGRILVAAGFELDVVHWTNRTFLPRRLYDLFVDVRLNLERLGPLLGPDCLKVMHIETAHCNFYNPAQRRRLAELEARRGIRLAPYKLLEPNSAIEHADAATILGNRATQATYAHAGKPLWPVPISQPFLYAFPEDKDFAAARRRFLWFGSGGLLHKGLDRVLEVFAALPELELTVLGPIDREPEFERAFRRELYGTPNIRTHGWIDVASPEFRALAHRHLALVYPSCSEGQNGGAITCMHAGLIPVLSRESGVDLDPEYGVELVTSSLEEIRGRVLELAARPPEELATMSRNAWEWVRAHHTRDQFSRGYARALREILERFRPALARSIRERER
ncbi:MAG: glycosyltransferase [Thermoanaerobaculia bacterium]